MELHKAMDNIFGKMEALIKVISVMELVMDMEFGKIKNKHISDHTGLIIKRDLEFILGKTKKFIKGSLKMILEKVMEKPLSSIGLPKSLSLPTREDGKEDRKIHLLKLTHNLYLNFILFWTDRTKSFLKCQLESKEWDTRTAYLGEDVMVIEFHFSICMIFLFMIFQIKLTFHKNKI